VAGDVTRPNLQLEVFQARDLDEKLTRLLTFCQEETGSGIVYAGTRARCEELAALLRRYGVNADHYHAGITNRDAVQDAFMKDQIRVVVATVAFGLGIDKPDIRFIVHYMPPPSLEAYYQEAGRAGRDGLPARCLLMYSSSDRGTLTRRANRDMLKVEFLRSVYGAVKTRLNHALPNNKAVRHANIPMADLTRDLRTDEVRVRVAISLLEEAGLLQRGPDLPRAAQVCLSDVEQECHPERSRRIYHLPDTAADDLIAFCKAARLYPGQWLTLDLVDVTRRAALPLDNIEQRLLTWQDEGWLSYRPSGRDLTLKLLSPPKDAHDRVAALLERYETIQAQHVDEITVYAQTDRCRHGHLNAYLGGRPIQRCKACDNCIKIPPPPDIGLPDKHEQRLIILRCVAGAPWSWGRQSLKYILRGSPKAPASAQQGHPGFGALAFRSSTAVGHMLKLLERKALLSPRELDHGGEVLDLTPAARKILASPNPRAELGKLVTKTKVTHTKKEEPDLPVDEMLFEKLCTWRREQARAEGMPAFIIFHNKHLRTIAAHQPVTLEALSELKGIGEHKLERYGEAVVALVKAHLKQICKS
jgi:ATP-dependent DNA helicase RecQ